MCADQYWRQVIPATAPSPHLHLRLLATTDLHCHIWPFDYDTDQPRHGIGLAALAPVIARAREERRNVVLLDNGDLLQGNALADYCAEQDWIDAPHPMISAMNLLGYDAATLGNHDFNYGLEPLRVALRHAAFPFVSSNILAADPETPFLAPFSILSREFTDEEGRTHLLRIGVVGAAPPQIVQWDAAILEGRLRSVGIVAAMTAQLPLMRAAGADLIVALCHSGPGDGLDDTDAENAALALAAAGGFDVIVAGHSHRHLPGTAYADLPGVDGENGRLGQTPAVMSGAYGAHLGVIDLVLEPGESGWRVHASETALRAVADESLPPEPRILELSRSAHDATRQKGDTVVGATLTRLHEAVALVGQSPALEFVAAAQRWRAAQLLGEDPAPLPLLSASAPFRAGSSRNGGVVFTDIPSGPLRLAHLSELSPFPNQLVLIEITGAVLRAWLDRSAAIFQTIPPKSKGHRLIVPDAPGYNFDVLHGVRYAIDVSVPSRYHAVSGVRLSPENPCRIRELTFAGTNVADDDRFVVATNSYRVSGGGHFDMLKSSPRVATAPETLRETLEAFVRAQSPIQLPQTVTWSFVPIGSEASFSGPVMMPDALRADPGLRLDGPDERSGAMSYAIRI